MPRWTWFGRLLAGSIIMLAASPGNAACQLSKYFDLPVTIVDGSPIVTIQINGHDARFILDSGAFFSTISRATALDYGLAISAVGQERLEGIGGDTSLGVVTAKGFRIAGRDLRNVDFAVGGSDTGYAGMLGQNILGLGDVEYDLPHGIVRIMKSQGCQGVGLAYWAGDKPFTMLKIEPMAHGQRHTIGSVTIDGTSVRAMFDTGADQSMLSSAAARRLGVRVDHDGTTADGAVSGIGQKFVRTWRTQFKTINLGGEAIPRPTFEVGDMSLDRVDMLIGIDFFLSHRVYVDNKGYRMFVTYEGGSVFGRNSKHPVDEHGVALDLVDRSGEPDDAAGYGRRGALRAAAQHWEEAIADYSKAVALAPKDAQYLVQRAAAHLANSQPLLGAADLDRAIEIAPDYADARLARAELRLDASDGAGALADLKAADAALPPSADARRRLAAMYDDTDAAAALANYDRWLASHPEDKDRASALNGRCWARALLGRELDKAMKDCDAALRLRPSTAAFLDSRALVHLRRGELDRALDDYDHVIALEPHSAWSLYARSVVERRVGKTAQADADRTAALTTDPRVGERAGRIHLEQ